MNITTWNNIVDYINVTYYLPTWMIFLTILVIIILFFLWWNRIGKIYRLKDYIDGIERHAEFREKTIAGLKEEKKFLKAKLNTKERLHKQ